MKDLLKRIKNNNFTIGIVGLGYVGLPLSLNFSSNGVKVIGFDVDIKKIESISKGESYINHIESGIIKTLREKELFIATNEFRMIESVDVIILCVPTPLNKYKEPDMSFILDTLDSIKPYLKKNQVLSLESTTYPGTTDELLKPMLESLGFRIGSDFFLVYSPEREDPGNPSFSNHNIPKIISGITKNSANAPCRGGIEISCRFGQMLFWPLQHAEHLPQDTSGLTVTLLPVFLPFTINPAAS